MKNFIVFLLLFPLATVAQKTNLIVGTSLTYKNVDDQIHPIYNNSVTNHEFTWTLNLGYQFHPIYRTSLQHKFILFTIPSKPIQTANIFGLSHQFNILPKKNTRLFAELGTHLGNYCSCRTELRSTNQMNFYLSWGLGGAIRLSPHFDLDLAFNSFRSIPKLPEYIGYTQYVIGVDYFFRKRPKKQQ